MGWIGFAYVASASVAGLLYLTFAAMHMIAGHFGSAAVHWLRFRRNPLVLYGAPDPIHQKATRRVGLSSAAWIATLLATTFWPTFRESVPGRPLLPVPVEVGWAVAVVGLVSMISSQYTMGATFRVGQDFQRPPELLCASGPHRYSRNPVYLGSWLYLAGMTLWWPGPLLVVTCALIGLGIHGLVLAEERFLSAHFGESYAAYCRQVPRYLFRSRP